MRFTRRAGWRTSGTAPSAASALQGLQRSGRHLAGCRSRRGTQGGRRRQRHVVPALTVGRIERPRPTGSSRCGHRRISPDSCSPPSTVTHGPRGVERGRMGGREGWIHAADPRTPSGRFSVGPKCGYRLRLRCRHGRLVHGSEVAIHGLSADAVLRCQLHDGLVRQAAT